MIKNTYKKAKVQKVIKEIYTTRNYSWYQDLFVRSQNCMDKIALFYRGTSITYREMFEKSNSVAKSFIALGIGKGDEVGICIDNIPELVYFMLGANRLGIILNVFGSKFNKNYIKSILANCNKKILITTDNLYGDFSDIVSEIEFDNIVMISLSDSLPNGKDPFYRWDDRYLDFTSKVLFFQGKDKRIITFQDYLNIGNNILDEVIDDNTLETEFTVTYTSGTTKAGYPKGVVHKNINYIALSRFHDKDVSGLPKMENIISLAMIPTFANTELTSNITDVLSQHCTVALEPIYNQNFFAYSLQINKSNFSCGSVGFWMRMLQMMETEDDLKDKDLKFLHIPCVTGEGISYNEEIYIDKKLKEKKAGISMVPRPLSPVTVSLGGGDCEHGGIFFTLYKGLKDRVYRKDYGMKVFGLAECSVLDKAGKRCKTNQWGNLVINAISEMKGYRNTSEEVNDYYIYDSNGKQWGNGNVWAYIDKRGCVHIGDRVGNEICLSSGEIIPMFMIKQKILEDKKNIISCEVVRCSTEENNKAIVAHLILQHSIKDQVHVIEDVRKRLRKWYGNEITDNLYFKVRGEYEGYPLTHSGKRDIRALEEEGIPY